MLFIDARKLGHMVDRTRKEFSDDDIARIAGDLSCLARRNGCGAYEDVPGFCKALRCWTRFKRGGYVLTPGLYVGAADAEEDDVLFVDRFAALQGRLEQQFQDTATLTEQIRAGLGMISYARN